MLRRPWILIGGGLALLVAVPVAWYLISPLFITRAVDEALPTARPAIVAAATQPPVTPTEAVCLFGVLALLVFAVRDRRGP